MILFTLFKTITIVPLLLSICGINSNIAISEKQAIEFFRCLGYDFKSRELELWLDVVERNEEGRIPIKCLTDLFISHSNFNTNLDSLREVLIKEVLLKENYNNIIKRRNFYQDYINQYYLPSKSNYNYRLPALKESCREKIVRKIEKKPHPLYTDYFDPEKARSIGKIINAIRFRYGYSQRPVKDSSVLLKSMHSDKLIMAIQTPKSDGLFLRSLVVKRSADTIEQTQKSFSPPILMISKSYQIRKLSKVYPCANK